MSAALNALSHISQKVRGVLGLILIIDKLSAWIGKAFAWCILVMTFGVTYEVIVRYLPRLFRGLGIDGLPGLRDAIDLMAPTPWAFDMSYIMYAALFMMAGAYTLSRDGHVRADMLYRRFRPRRQAILDLSLYIIFFFPGILALVFIGWEFAGDSWRYKEVSINSPANVPIFQLKLIIPAAGLFLAIQGVAQVMRCILCIQTGQWPVQLEDVDELESFLTHALEDAGIKKETVDIKSLVGGGKT